MQLVKNTLLSFAPIKFYYNEYGLFYEGQELENFDYKGNYIDWKVSVLCAIGGTIGSKLAKKCGDKKIAGFLTGIGAIMAFIPAAIIEAKLTKQQKLSEKIASMLAIKKMQDSSLFAKSSTNSNSKIETNNSYIFENFIK